MLLVISRLVFHNFRLVLGGDYISPPFFLYIYQW